MEDKEKDQDTAEVKDDQSASEQSEDTKDESITLEKVSELAKGLQKGYTLTRQEISEMKDNLSAIANQVNKTTDAKAGDEEYLTVGKLKEVLAQYDTTKAQQEAANKAQIDKAIEGTLSELEADGIISSAKERENLLQYAVDNKIPDLNKAAAKWIKTQSQSKIQEVAKTKAKQEEGSKVGTSSKTSEGESRGVNYDNILKGIW